MKHRVAGGRAGRWLLLTTAVLQAAAPAVIGFRSDATDPPLVPPGPFFAVWGVVLVGCLTVAVLGLPATRGSAVPYRHRAARFSVRGRGGGVAGLIIVASLAVAGRRGSRFRTESA